MIAGSPREYSGLLVMVSWLGLTHIKEIGLSVIQKEEERGLSFVSEITSVYMYSSPEFYYAFCKGRGVLVLRPSPCTLRSFPTFSFISKTHESHSKTQAGEDQKLRP